MREIKFRGYQSKLKKWVYGDLIHARGGGTFIFDYKDGFEDRIEVIPESVGQLWMKIGDLEIYDGDIFTVNGKYPKLAKYIPERGCFCAANIDELRYGDVFDVWQSPAPNWWNDFKRDIAVIGNIFENKELIEK